MTNPNQQTDKAKVERQTFRAGAIVVVAAVVVIACFASFMFTWAKIAFHVLVAGALTQGAVLLLGAVGFAVAKISPPPWCDVFLTPWRPVPGWNNVARVVVGVAWLTILGLIFVSIAAHTQDNSLGRFLHQNARWE